MTKSNTTNELIHDGQSLAGAKYKSSDYSIQTYDDGFGPLWIMRDSIGIMGIARARTWEDAYSIAEDEFFPEAAETVEELVKEYGFKRAHVKVIHPAVRTSLITFDIDYSTERDATPADYELTGGRLLDGQFVRWETRETPDPDGWIENELFQESYGFRPNGRNERDKLGHGIYSKDLNGEYLDPLTAEMLAEIGIELEIEGEVEE